MALQVYTAANGGATKCENKPAASVAICETAVVAYKGAAT